ncbi:ATP-binding protein [Gordonibacter urolithinfaciens]|uniref:ATP-binding protein n=1 Tax=Gordonibacter urolithinfaciens TaxID=1335613 RepID=UPI003AABB4B7
MIRTIVEIDEVACNGCGLCVDACHEGAIGLVGGKARLLRDDYCDGLGDCLPACPAGAISFVQREAEPYDEQAVLAAKGAAPGASAASPEHAGAAPEPVAATRHAGGCPGSLSRFFAAEDSSAVSAGADASADADALGAPPKSRLAQWPVEIKLVPTQAPYFAGAHVLVAADCTAFAHADFHRRFMDGKTTVIGCPKLDAVDYTGKLAEIFASNDVASVTVARMEVPCCGGLEQAARTALARSGKDVPFAVATISTRGELL